MLRFVGVGFYDFLYKPCVTERSGVEYFSTSWTRYSLNTDERTQELEGNMESDVLGGSVTSNLENCQNNRRVEAKMFVDCIQHRCGSRAALYSEAEEPLSIPQPYSGTAGDPSAIISGVCRSSVHHLQMTKSDKNLVL